MSTFRYIKVCEDDGQCGDRACPGYHPVYPEKALPSALGDAAPDLLASLKELCGMIEFP